MGKSHDPFVWLITSKEVLDIWNSLDDKTIRSSLFRELFFCPLVNICYVKLDWHLGQNKQTLFKIRMDFWKKYFWIYKGKFQWHNSNSNEGEWHHYQLYTWMEIVWIIASKGKYHMHFNTETKSNCILKIN